MKFSMTCSDKDGTNTPLMGEARAEALEGLKMPPYRAAGIPAIPQEL
jgi:hypothetical protein